MQRRNVKTDDLGWISKWNLAVIQKLRFKSPRQAIEMVSVSSINQNRILASRCGRVKH